MLRTDLIEQATIKVVAELIENSPSLQSAIRNASEKAKDNVEILQSRLQSVKVRLAELDFEKDLDKKRLNILLSIDCTPDEVQQIKNEYLADCKKIQADRGITELLIKELEESLRLLKDTMFSWQSVAKFALKVQEQILEKDPVAMKNALYALFKRIVVGPAGANGERQIT